MKRQKQIIVPAVTPLTQEFTLDHTAVERMFSNFSSCNMMPFILGTTGEAASLPVEVKQDYIDLAVKLKGKESTLYAGIASNCLEESLRLARYAFDKGVDVVAAHLPSYYTLSRDLMLRYFEQLASALPGPLIIYNIPATTHMSIPLEVIDTLSMHPNIIGTKDSERSEERLQQSLALWKDREDFSHYLGWAAKSADALLNGSTGLIPSTGNLYPSIYSKMLQATEEGDTSRVYALQQQSDAWGDAYQKGRLLGESLWALKVLMRQEGLCQEHMMPPLQPLSKEEEEKLILIYQDLQTKEPV
jgi:dihydrodipicolinate synthase/N-acetylneuraminate lyase